MVRINDATASDPRTNMAWILDDKNIRNGTRMSLFYNKYLLNAPNTSKKEHDKIDGTIFRCNLVLSDWLILLLQINSHEWLKQTYFIQIDPESKDKKNQEQFILGLYQIPLQLFLN